MPYVRQWLGSFDEPPRFVEPFAGGANVGLTVAIEGLAKHVTLIEIDPDVAAVWETVLNGHARNLANRILSFRVSKRSVNAVLAKQYDSSLSRAFATILKNRVRRGGILADGASLLKRGENDKGLKSRWYPETLQRRIETVSQHGKKITFLQGDGVSFIRSHCRDRHLAFFIDPPYTVAGRRLYAHSNLDHRELFETIASVRGNMLVTYDNCAPIRKLAREFGFQIKRVSMRTAHHSNRVELLIGRDFSWLNRRKLDRP